jgi:hypothetical protein
VSACQRAISVLSFYLHSLRRFRKIAKTGYCLRRVCPSTWNNSAPTGCIFMIFHIYVFFENPLKKSKFRYNLPRITSAVHEDVCTVMVKCLRIPLRMRSVSHTCCREKSQHCHRVITQLQLNIIIIIILCSLTFFRKPFVISDVERYGEPESPQMTIRRVRIGCLISKATDTLRMHCAYCFSTATMVTRTRLGVTLYVRCLACSK